MATYKLDLDDIAVSSFQTATTEPKLDPNDDSVFGMCTCIDICPTDDTCIAYGCPSGPGTIITVSE